MPYLAEFRGITGAMNGDSRGSFQRWSDSTRAAVVRFLFERLYHEFAWAYDWVSATFWQGHWRTWQRAVLAEINAGPVLELGFGTGDLLGDLAQRSWPIVGVDASSQMVRRARRKLARRGLAVPLVRGRAQALPFAANSFATVVSTFPSDFITDPGSLQEIARVLIPGGRLVVVEGAQTTLTGPARPAPRLLYRLVYGSGRAHHLPIPAAIAGLQAAHRAVDTPAGQVLLFVASKPAVPG